jgi:hypothetical protein
MKIKNISLFSILIISIIVIVSYFSKKEYVENNHTYIGGMGDDLSLPVSLKMYDIIEELCDTYDIPKHIVYNIAFLETRYEGPFDWDYNPYLTSDSGAEGPMQIMPSTANGIHNCNIDRKTLRTNLNLNIETSMKLLQRLFDKYGDWSLVCGSYNTGRPIINNYTLFCVNNKDYRKNWISPY